VNVQTDMTTLRRTLTPLPTALLPLALLLAALTLATACTSDDPQPTTTPTPSPTPTTEATQTPTTTPTPIVSPRTPTPTPTFSARILPPGLRVRTAPGGLDLGRLPAQERVTVVGRVEVSLPTPITWLGLEGLGWVRYHRNSIELRGDLETLAELDYFDPRPNAPLHSDDTRTSIAAVDTIIEAVATMDTATLTSLVDIHDAKFDISACGGDSGPAEELPIYIDALFDPSHGGYGPEPTTELTPLHLYAVFQDEPFFSDYVIRFAYSPGSIGRSLGVSEDGRITRIGYGCGAPVTTGGPASPPPLIAPYLPPPLTPPVGITAPPSTDTPEVDAVFRAIETHDAATLLAMVETTEAECTSDAHPGYNLRCSELGLNPGDTYEGLSSGNCDAGLIPTAAISQLFTAFVGTESPDTTPYGAYLTRDEIYLGRTAVVMFADPDSDPPASYRQIGLTEGRITFVGASCANAMPSESDVGLWLIHPSQLGYDVPPPDIDPAATRPAEGSPFGGADLILALHARGIAAHPYHEGIGLCGRVQDCQPGILYQFGAPQRAGASYLWVYETIEARAAEWELAPDGRATALVGTPPGGPAYGNANLVLVLATDDDETARLIVEALLLLTP
jgi:hypothetical protein